MRPLFLCLCFLILPCAQAQYSWTPEIFGAVGDGVTDDSQAFIDAIDMARVWNAPVILSAKTYRIEQTLLVYSNSTMIGQGSHLTTLSFSDLPVAIQTPPDPAPDIKGKYQNVRLEGFSVQCSLRQNTHYEGIKFRGVDYPVMRDIVVRDVSVGHAIVFAQCRKACPGDISGLRAEHCNYTIPQPVGLNTAVIHFSDCEDLFVENLCVIDATGAGPADQRDAISCVLSNNVTIHGMRGIQIDSLLDAGRNDHCLFENFYARDAKQIPVYSNNGNRYCTFRNGRFEKSDFGILVLAPKASTGFPVDSYNVFENFEFYEPAGYGDAHAGIEVWAADGEPARAPHDNLFRNIHFVDPGDPPNLTRVINETASVPGLNTYHQVTVDTPNSTQVLADRITGPANNGANLQGFEEKIGRVSYDLDTLTASQWETPVITIDGIQTIEGVTVSVNTTSIGDSVQFLHAVVRAISGNQFRIVMGTLDGAPIGAKVTGIVSFTYRVLGE